jgi:hypothetical protein
MRDLPWHRAVRPAALWRRKLAGIPVFMAAFFTCYFLVLRHPITRVTTMPVTALDRLIGFHPGAFALYVSLWLYVILPAALAEDPGELAAYALAAAALAAAGLAIFLVWPTAVPLWDIDWARFGALGRLKSVDATGNACPSLHVAFAVLAAVWLERRLRVLGAPFAVRAANLGWCAGILYSTIATRQHVAVDLVAGAALGAIVARFVRFRPPAVS